MGDNIVLTVAPEGASGEAWQKREGKNGQKNKQASQAGFAGEQVFWI